MLLKNSGSHTMPKNNDNKLFDMPYSLIAERQFSVSLVFSEKFKIYHNLKAVMRTVNNIFRGVQ